MQVRKYEATSIKEAVQQVKEDLGPDAIILSTREAERRLGASVGKRVIVTAAVNEATYHKKQLVDSQLTDSDRERLRKKPVRAQRQVIDHIFQNINQKREDKGRKISQVPYALIEDDEPELKKTPQRVATSSEMTYSPKKTDKPSAKKRVLSAVKEAAEASEKGWFSGSLDFTKEIKQIGGLKKEIDRLKHTIRSMEANKIRTEVSGERVSQSVIEGRHKYLTELGIADEIARTLLKSAEKSLGEHIVNKAKLDSWIAKWILKNIKVDNQPLKNRLHFFAGPRGGGKTSTLVKMASHLAIKHQKRVAIITTDTEKIGATEQLRIYSQILNIPFAVWHQEQKIEDFLSQLHGVDHILFDTVGSSLLNGSDMDRLQNCLGQKLPSKSVHLVLPAHMRDQELYSLVRRYECIKYDDVILTNMDQIQNHGILLNLQNKTKAPYYSFSYGPKVPEDFEWASKEQVLDYIFKISKSQKIGGRHEK